MRREGRAAFSSGLFGVTGVSVDVCAACCGRASCVTSCSFHSRLSLPASPGAAGAGDACVKQEEVAVGEILFKADAVGGEYPSAPLPG